MQLTITQQSYSKNLSFNIKYYCNYNRNPGYIQITDTGKFYNNNVWKLLRLGDKFHPRYLPVAFTCISRHGK